MHVMEMLSLKGKVALVTGGAGNYGRPMVEALAEAGATVITASRTLEKNEEYAAKLRQQGLQVYAEAYDQGDEQSILALRDRLVAAYGKVDVLVNNSALRGCFSGGFDGGTMDGFAESLRVNGAGMFIMSRTFGNLMVENGGGSIINIGSYMGNLGPNEPLYEGTDGMSALGAPDYFFHKSGMHNLTRFLAGNYGLKGVRVNCLALGGLFNNQHPAFIENYSKSTYVGRLAVPDDVKGIMVYLASDASKYLTGTVIPLDGGYSAK